MSRRGIDNFAGGFIQAFMAAYRMRMDQERMDRQDAMFKAIYANQQGHSDAIRGAFDKAASASPGANLIEGKGGAATGDMSASAKEVDAYTRQAAQARGIDPNVASHVISAESSYGQNYAGDGGSSFGPFQLHYGGVNPNMPHPGMGDDFTKATGLDARDEGTWKQQIDFALDGAAKNGWGAWTTMAGNERAGLDNAKPIGITPYDTAPTTHAMPLPSSGTGTGVVTQGGTAHTASGQTVKTDADGYALPQDQQDASYKPPTAATPLPSAVAANPPSPPPRPDDTAPATGSPSEAPPPDSGSTAFAPILPPPPDDTVTPDIQPAQAEAYAEGGSVGSDDNTPLPTPPATDAGSDTPLPSAPALQATPAPQAAPVSDADLPAPDAQDVAYSNYPNAHIHGGGGRAPHFSIPGGRSPSGGVRMPKAIPDTQAIHPEDVEGGAPPQGAMQPPQVIDGQGGVSPGASNAIMDGIKGLFNLIGGGGQGAMPNSPQVAQAQTQVGQGAYAASPQEMEAITKTVDPFGSLPTGLRTIAGLEAVHSYYLGQGDPVGAQRIAMAMVQGSQKISAMYGAQAAKLMQSGKMGPALKALEEGYNSIPDGRTVSGQPMADGNVQVTQYDTNGKPMGSMVAGPDKIMAAAIGLAGGQLYYQMLGQVAPTKGGAGNQPVSRPMQLAQAWMSGQGQPPVPSQPQPSAQGGQGQPQFQPAVASAPAQPSNSSGDAPSVPQDAPHSTPLPSAPPAAPQAGGQLPPNGPTQPAPQPQAAPAGVSQPPASPAPQGAIPTTPGGAPDVSQMDPLVQQRDTQLQLQRDVYSHLPQPPQQLTQAPPNWNELTPNEQRAFQQQQKQAFASWYRGTYAPAKAQGDQFIKDQTSYERSRALNIQQSNLEAQREQGKANMPWSVDNSALMGGDTDAFTHASNMLPTAFAQPGTDPKAAAQAYSQRFSPEEQESLTDATVNVARTSQMQPQSAARIVGAIVTPNKDPTQKDVPPFRATYDQSRGAVHVVFPNGYAAFVPRDAMARLVYIRQQQQAKQAQIFKQEQGRAADKAQTSANQQRLGDQITDKATETAHTPGGLFGNAPSPFTGAVPSSPYIPQGYPQTNPGLKTFQ